MKKIIAVALAVVVGAAALSACEDGKPSAVTDDRPKRPTLSVPTPTLPTAVVGKATLPDFTAMGHQQAQDTAQAIGFYNLREEDASGAGRFLVLDRNWKVCSQSPAPGLYAIDQVVTLRSVKLNESCP